MNCKVDLNLYIFFSMFLSMVFFANNVFPQNLPESATISEKSISVSGGLGRLTIRDKAISNESYSGSLGYFSLDWKNFREKRGFQIGFEFQGGSEIKHRNLSAEIILFSLELDYLYAMKPFLLFNKNTTIYLGPATGTNLYIRKQNIAFSSADDDAISIFSTIPVGIKSKISFSVNQKLLLEADLYLNILSLGLRFPSNAEDEVDVKLLHPINGFKGDIDLTLRYKMFKKLSLSLALKQQAARISAWDEELLYGNSSLVMGLQYTI